MPLQQMGMLSVSSLSSQLKARVSPDELAQLAITDVEIDFVIASASEFVGLYGITSEELILKVAIYNLYLRNTTQMSEALTRDYEATLRALNSLKKETTQTINESFAPTFKTQAKQDLEGY